MDTVDTEVVQPRAETDGFKKVSRRKMKKKKKKKQEVATKVLQMCPYPCPQKKSPVVNSIVIKPGQGSTYAEILKDFVQPDAAEVTIHNVKKTLGSTY